MKRLRLNTNGMEMTEEKWTDLHSQCYKASGSIIVGGCVDWWFEHVKDFCWHAFDPDSDVKKSSGCFRCWDGSKWAEVKYLYFQQDLAKLWPSTPESAMSLIIKEIKLNCTKHAEFIDPVHTSKVYCKNNAIALDGDNMTLVTNKPSNYNISCMPIEYDPTARCPFWEELMQRCLGYYGDDSNTWTADKELIEVFQEFLGYALQGSCRAEKFMLLIGVGGNGKSVVLKALSDVLFGETAGYSALSRFGEADNGVADLVDKRIIYHPDEPEVSWKRLDNTIKNLVSGEPILATRKYITGAYVPLTGKGIWGMNHFPKFSDLGHSITRRMLAIPFNRSFTAVDKVDMTTDEIIAKLMDEKAGIFNWALTGLSRLAKNEWQFTKSTLMETTAIDAMNEYDTIGLWLDDAFVVTGNPKDKVAVFSLFESYLEYCSENYIKEDHRKSLRTLASAVISKDPRIRRARIKKGKSASRAVSGVVFR